MRLAEKGREELRRRIIEGCAEMRTLYEEIDREWESVSDEVWRDAQQVARRGEVESR